MVSTRKRESLWEFFYAIEYHLKSVFPRDFFKMASQLAKNGQTVLLLLLKYAEHSS
jgi:hypothetical protein